MCAYKIETDSVNQYIDYLRKFKKKMIENLVDFERELKKANSFWDDNNYVLTIEAKNKVADQQKILIEEIDRSIKKLKMMNEEYEKYLKRRR